MVHDGQICATIEWGFAGSCPLSGLLDELFGGVGSGLCESEDDMLEYRR